MLKVGNLTQNQSNDIFSNSSSVKLLPLISAEWNQNIFNSPYFTVSGDASLIQPGTPTGSTVSNVTDPLLIKPNFTTKSVTTSSGTASISYPITATNKTAYKVVFFVKTNNALPLMINTYATDPIFGSYAEEVNSFGWTKIQTYIGSSSAISSFNYNITFNRMSYDDTEHTVYFTVPEIYETTYFDYQYNSVYPTRSVFSNFRPGESYVPTGNNSYVIPDNYRRIKNQILSSETLSGGYYGNKYMPISPVVNNPSFTLATIPVPVYKNVLISDMSPYKYFVSDVGTSSNPQISAKYETPIYANKIVIKFNSLMTTPSINLKINGVIQTVDSSTTITLNSTSKGELILYWNGSAWTKNRWSTMPTFNDNGVLTTYTTFSKITIEQISKVTKTEFTSYASASTNVSNDLTRMQLIEISPRLEIDITDYVENFSITKSLDSSTSTIPISSINSNDASITISNIPIDKSNLFIPLFSNQSNIAQTILKNMLRKNVKFYTNYKIESYSKVSDSSYTSNGSIIPAGIFYSDSWEENDVDTVTVQAYDISRYLQSTPVPDYVASLRSVFDIITNLLDLAGYTDYDYDSLYDICNSKTAPIDLAYYYTNSKDSTIIQALAEIFLAYQIGAYIDEYGIMKFLSLSNILSSQSSSLTITDNDVEFGGFSANNEQKPGKISLRYQPPKIKQSASIQNAIDPKYVNSSSFVYTTSNDVLWSQQNIDTVGYNYLSSSLLKNENKFQINVPSQYDLFHTYNISSDGFAAIENEIVSFAYKEYNISKLDNSNLIKVSVKNNIELEAEINRYIKKYSTSLQTSTGTTKSDYRYDIKVEPTGYITNVKRGLFGTKIKDHKMLSTLTDKELSQATCSSSYSITTGGTTAAPNTSTYTIEVTPNVNNKTLVYPTTDRDNGYRTYSTKFKFVDQGDSGASAESTKVQSAGLFFNMASTSSPNNTYFLELTRYSLEQDSKGNNIYKYVLVLYYINSGVENIVAWVDLTSEVNYILSNLPQVFVPQKNSQNKIVGYKVVVDESFSLKLVHYPKETNPDDGENSGELVDIFLNNVEITGWQVPSGNVGESVTITSASQVSPLPGVPDPQVQMSATNTFKAGDLIEIKNASQADYNGIYDVVSASSSTFNIYSDWFGTTTGTATRLSGGTNSIKWTTTGVNNVTKLFKRITLPQALISNSIYGSFSSTLSIAATTKLVDDYLLIPYSTSTKCAYINEIYACGKALNQRGVNYYFQDREFLNGIVQGYNLSNIKEYIMQTKPAVYGINYYDIQYSNPAATSADVLPIEYLIQYFPGDAPGDQKYFQKLIVDDHSVSYSTPINTGFRARMAIANSSPYLVFLNKDADQVSQLNVKLNLWTHEIIAPSDQEIIEKVTDYSNISETLQLDSEWIQSKDAAYKTLNVVEKAIDSFSKNISLTIFGNPLIQVGDIITLTYAPAGINQQKYVVKSISNSFESGLNTSLGLSMIGQGVEYSASTALYTITYNGNGNTGGSTPSSVTQGYGTTFSVSSAGTLVKSGYAFNGWNTAADGSGVSYAAGSTYIVGISNETLYAQWVSAPPTITSTTYGTAGRTGMTFQTVSSGTTDNGYYTINLPYSITFNGQSYSTIYVGTNSYVTFGGGSSAGTSLSSSNPALDKIMVSAVDGTTVDGSTNGGLWFESSASFWRIRYQGRKTTEPANSPTIIWELSSQSTTPNRLTLQIGLTTSGGVTNVSSSTGTVWSSLGSSGTGWNITS